MNEVLGQIAMLLIFLSVITFFISIILLFFKEQRKLGLKLIIGSVIAFIIGFSTCAMTFKLGPMH